MPLREEGQKHPFLRTFLFYSLRPSPLSPFLPLPSLLSFLPSPLASSPFSLPSSCPCFFFCLPEAFRLLLTPIGIASSWWSNNAFTTFYKGSPSCPAPSLQGTGLMMTIGLWGRGSRGRVILQAPIGNFLLSTPEQDSKYGACVKSRPKHSASVCLFALDLGGLLFKITSRFSLPTGVFSIVFACFS